MQVDLKGQVALITGASVGFGRSISLSLAGAGAHVILNARNADRLRALKEEINRMGGQAATIPADMAREEEILSLFKTIRDEFKNLDIAVNNAGIDRVGELSEFSLKDYDDIMNVNVRGLYICCQQEVKMMIPARKGHIINISSVCGFRGFVGQSAYVASKHAVNGISKCLALEVQKYGISVSLIGPGAADTELGRTYNPQLDQSTLIRSEDIAKTALYLLSLSDTAMVDEVYVRRKVDVPFLIA